MANSLPEHIDGLFQYLSNSEEKANEDLILKYFRKIFGDSFTRQKEAANSDGYVKGLFVLELKSKQADWFSGLFQAIAYQRKLDFAAVVVSTKGMLAIWKVADLDPQIIAEIISAKGAASTLGKQFAKKYIHLKRIILSQTTWIFRNEIIDGLFKATTAEKIKEIESFENSLKSQKRIRRKITIRNFTDTLVAMKVFFAPENPIKVVRAFYSMVFGWDEDSTLEISQKNPSQATINGESVDSLLPGQAVFFKKFVENHYIFYSETESLDDFFAKYDKAIDAVDNNFRKKHGIFFTDLDLAKFTMWIVKQKLGDIGKNHLVIDPACGSGNLVTNWKSPLELRHKVVSEIEPELLYTVEKRMKGDAWHNGKFTVVPKVSENKGLNFLDISAEQYIEQITGYLAEKGQSPDKPLAFLCNPPYRNEDEQTASNITYAVHPSIMNMVGKDASSERYCCFLAQMKLICQAAKDGGLPGESLLFLFTKSAWLTNRPVFKNIRNEILGSFEDVSGVLIDGKEFFDVKGRFPIAFTIWRYKGENSGLNSSREIPLVDLTWMRKKVLSEINWLNKNDVDLACNNILSSKMSISIGLGANKTGIKEWSGQTSKDFKRSRRVAERDAIVVGGLPLNDRRQTNKKAYGECAGEFIGFMDDLTPCRVKKGTVGSIWFRLDIPMMDFRKSRCLSGPPSQKGYFASNAKEASKVFYWYALAKSFTVRKYPISVDAENMWKPIIPSEIYMDIFKLSSVIVFAENECLETIFPANNPIQGGLELFVGNPLSPNNSESFWRRIIEPLFEFSGNTISDKLYCAVINLFAEWKKLFINSPEILISYKKAYFVGDGVLTENAGIVQIKDYAKHYQHEHLLYRLAELSSQLKLAKLEFYDLISDPKKIDYFGNNKITSISFIDLRLQLASLIVDKNRDVAKFGRVRLAKTFYLCDMVTKQDLKTTYQRKAAGPLDHICIYNKNVGIESLAEKSRCFSVSRNTKANSQQVSYHPEQSLEFIAELAKDGFADDYQKIEKLIELLKPLNTAQCEIIATLYACWNDMLIDGKQPLDQNIVNDFLYNWHESKTRYSEQRLFKALTWMKDNQLVPNGEGKPTTVIH
ncbi:hypothetical protein [Psychromonas aquimarina]|uniref:hypothetical protein n=1 Tax=Psychromonas aquimarina TaxID=444919 RepID=UPI0003FB1276|nr:hypothetical protein [Psychromonas aquimarina]